MNGTVMVKRLGVFLGGLLLALSAFAEESDAIPSRDIQERLRTANDSVSKEVGRLVTGYQKQTPEVLCAAMKIDAVQATEHIFEALQAGATQEQIPISCECLDSDDNISSLIQGALVNDVNAADVASECLPYLSRADAIKEELIELLSYAEEGSFNYILSTAYDALTDLDISGAEDVLVDSLVEGGVLSFDGAECGEACVRPFAETLVQNVIDVQQGGLVGDLFGGPTIGSPEPPGSSE